MDIKDVDGLSELSRLKLSEREKEKILTDMKSILDYVGQVGGIKGSNQKTEINTYNVWREDEPEERKFSRDLLVQQFPEEQDGFLKVKKIL